jgi:lysosomal alpha-mannosidase
MGSDFQYTNANIWFKNLDKLIYYVNQRQKNGSKINIFYSTPSCYLYSLYKSNSTWSTKNDDFFPYAHRGHSFWTGYFTSRSALKNYVRRANTFLHSMRQIYLTGIIRFPSTNAVQVKKAFDILDQAIAVAQHHDAISGTERQVVADDYAFRLASSSAKLFKEFIKASAYYISPGYYCPLLNISECYPSENLDGIILILQNALGQHIDVWVRIPVNSSNYVVKDLNFNLVFFEVVVLYNETLSIPERNSKAHYELVFKAPAIPPVGYNFYEIQISDSTTRKHPLKKQMPHEFNSKFIFQNNYLSVEFDQNGNLLEINNLESGINTKLSQTFCFYKSMVGNNSAGQFQASGAYIFRSDGDPICMIVKSFIVQKGVQFSEIHQIFSNFISQTIRLYNDSKTLSFEWLVGPIDISDNIGKEIFTRFSSDLKSNSTFYTDSNGREILKRNRNYRPSWPFIQTETVSGNYYPVNSRIFIRDENANVSRQLTIVTDRSHGGSSIIDGSIEIMLHRRILHDDSLGVHEPLNETGADGNGLVVLGNFHLIFNLTKNSAKMHRELSHRINNQPLLLFTTEDFSGLKDDYFSFLNAPLPENVHLLTLMPDFNSKFNNSLLIRLEHFYELNDDPILSQPSIVDLKNLFNSELIIVLGFEELSLGTNMGVNEVDERLIFDRKSKSTKKSALFEITLSSMEIRTFRVWYSIKNSV